MRPFVSALAVAALAQVGLGATYFADSFNHATDASNLSAPWTTTNVENETGQWVGEAPGLSFAGLTTSGNAATTTNRFTNARAGLTGGIPVAGGNTTQTFYVSYLLRVDSADGWGETLIAGVTSSSLSYADGFHSGLYRDDAGLHFGVSIGARPADRSAARAAIATATVAPGSQTYFVLAKYQIDTSTAWDEAVVGGLRGSMKVYMDALPSVEPTVWDLSVTANKGSPFGDPDLQLNQALLSRTNSGDNGTFDELRITSTFAEAVAVPEPAAMSLLGVAGLLALRRRR